MKRHESQIISKNILCFAFHVKLEPVKASDIGPNVIEDSQLGQYFQDDGGKQQNQVILV
jgi:hypothetical protein